MQQENSKKQLHENNSSYLLLDIENGTGLKSNEQSKIVATEKNQSVLGLSIQHYIVSSVKGLSHQDLEMKSLKSDVVQDESITVSVITEKQFCKPSLTSKTDYYLGMGHECYRTPATFLVTEPAAYLVLSFDEAESWLGDLCEKRSYLRYSRGYKVWVLCCYDIGWAIDLIYRSIAVRIAMLFGK